MLLKRFYDDRLAQASYLVGCQRTGEALIVDPNRDIDAYVRAAGAEGLRITHVTETHIHADFVSGALELAERTGARLHLSGEGGPDWSYAFAQRVGAVVVRDGDHFMVGNVRIDAVHTPGHTPEHLTFLVTDGAGADRAMGALTGDFLFVGDVGRPDLLERAAKVAGTMRDSARRLFGSLRRFRDRPDWLQIWPGHGAGSACGKALGAVPQSTLGYEKLFNWAFAHTDEDAFVAAVLDGQPEPPTYFAQMKRINRVGPRVLGGFTRPERLPATRLADLLSGGALVVDTRHAADFADRHVPGTINITLNRAFTTWAGWLLPYDRDVFLLVDDSEGAARGAAIDVAVRDLAMIGLDRVAGWFGADAIDEWTDVSGRALATVSQTTPAELAARMSDGTAMLLDVRDEAEWRQERVAGARHVPVGLLPAHLGELPRDRPIVVLCLSGSRSAIAASLLRAAGITDVSNLRGGLAAWQELGLPVSRGGEVAADAPAALAARA
jgi:hydroxyacylglutathione hydrolase